MAKIVMVNTKEKLDRIIEREIIDKKGVNLSVVINKESIFISKKPIDKEVVQDPLFDLESISVSTGIKDFARQHDFYIYGTYKGKTE